MAKQIASAYTSIAADDCAVFLGMTAADAVSKVTAAPYGWTYDDGAKMLTTVQVRPSFSRVLRNGRIVSFSYHSLSLSRARALVHLPHTFTYRSSNPFLSTISLVSKQPSPPLPSLMRCNRSPTRAQSRPAWSS